MFLFCFEKSEKQLYESVVDNVVNHQDLLAEEGGMKAEPFFRQNS